MPCAARHSATTRYIRATVTGSAPCTPLRATSNPLRSRASPTAARPLYHPRARACARPCVCPNFGRADTRTPRTECIIPPCSPLDVLSNRVVIALCVQRRSHRTFGHKGPPGEEGTLLLLLLCSQNPWCIMR
jgi:hypothetical protein